MRALRRAIGRKEVVLGLLLSLLAGGWFSWHWLIHPAMAQTDPQPAEQTPVAQEQQAAGQGAQAGPLADLESRVARAIALRAGLDEAAPAGGGAQQALQIRQELAPIFAASPTQPASESQAQPWRHALAMLADSHLQAAEAGDSTAEASAKALLQQSCPADAWACYFQIPEKALQSARSADGAIDDHARAAMLTATGFLYALAGDRPHCDRLFRKAIQAYGRLLEGYDGWTGEVKDTITPQGRFKKVGEEFYTYRNRMERLAKYSADWWGRCVVDGQVSLEEALSQCDHKLFRAIVRVRADRRTDPIVILHEERIREADFSTVADWFQKRPHDPQAEWERERGELIARIGQEEVQAISSIGRARDLLEQKQHDAALALLGQGLQTEPTLAETGVSLRCEAAWVMMDQQRYTEALGVLDDANQMLKAGDARLAQRDAGGLRGRIGYYRVQCARGTNSYAQAVQLAEEIVADSEVSLSLRGRTLVDLVDLHIEASDRLRALDAYERLAALPAASPQSEGYLQVFLRVAQSRLTRKGWYMSPVGR